MFDYQQGINFLKKKGLNIIYMWHVGVYIITPATAAM